MAATFQKKRTFKIHINELLAGMVFLAKKVSPEDLANYMYDDKWGDADKYDILNAVNTTLTYEMNLQKGKRREDHYGLREKNGLYWLNYNVGTFE